MFKFFTILCATLTLLTSCAASLEHRGLDNHHGPPSPPHPPGYGHGGKPSRRTYKLTDNVVGKDFFKWFMWDNYGDQDPTHGRVFYPDLETSRRENTTFAKHDTFILRADDTKILDPEGSGRLSARIKSKKTFTKHVAIFDVRHMPQGCGAWPAIWEVLDVDWPTGGEVDIVEGVHNNPYNHATLHTTTGCTMPEERQQQGINGQLDCDWLVNWNRGCTVQFQGNHTYGPNFNSNGGGWFAVERYEEAINVFFWPRNSRSVPNDVKYPINTVNPRSWGLPMANFPNTQCDFKKHFKENHIIINLTFCGDWAGNQDVYSGAGCPGTCVDYVNNNPAAFSDAYFDIGSIRVFQ